MLLQDWEYPQPPGTAGGPIICRGGIYAGVWEDSVGGSDQMRPMAAVPRVIRASSSDRSCSPHIMLGEEKERSCWVWPIVPVMLGMRDEAVRIDTLDRTDLLLGTKWGLRWTRVSMECASNPPVIVSS